MLLLGTITFTSETLQERAFQETSSLVELQLCTKGISYQSYKLLENPPFPAGLKKPSLQTAKNVSDCRIPL